MSLTDDFRSQIKAIEKKISDVEEQYVRDNSDQTLIGKRVVVTMTGAVHRKIFTAWLDGYEVSPFSSKIVPILLREKKDGTKSKNKHYLSAGTNVTCEEATEDNMPKPPAKVMLELTCGNESCPYLGYGVCSYEEGDYCKNYVRKR